MPNAVDCCRFTAASSGTGDFVVSAAVTGYQTPGSAGAVNATVYRYRAESADLTQWEIGYGAYTSAGTTLARTTVIANSSGGTGKITFTNAPQVAVVLLAEDFVTGQTPGTATNDNATAGNVGEYIECHGNGNASATVTITIASPGVVSWTGHGLSIGHAVNFTTTGALPTGLAANTTYYVSTTGYGANSFALSTSVANALAGTNINTSGTQSGTHTGKGNGFPVTGTAIDVGGISLTAGDWDVDCAGTFFFGSTTSFTSTRVSISTVSATLDGTLNRYTAFFNAATTPGVSGVTHIHAGPARFSLSATTTIFCVLYSDFATSTPLVATPCLRARRVR